jgi:hypothetical protein
MKHENPVVEEFITKLALLLFKGDVTPEEIYETLMEVNDNDQEAAVYCRDRAVSMAASFQMTFVGAAAAN